MLSRRARKTRHVAAARYLEDTWPGEQRDIAEVLASHYQEAIRADPDADDVPALRASARGRLTAAGQAAASLALGPEADALELYQRSGRAFGGTAAIALAFALRNLGRMDEARAPLEGFRSAEVADTDQIVRAEALTELASTFTFAGELEEAGPLIEEALTTLELGHAGPVLANALISRAVFLILSGRLEEGIGVLRHALTLADEYDLPAVMLRARYNLAAVALERDRFNEAIEEVNRGLVLARERGDRYQERRLLTQSIAPLVVLGRWDEALSAGAPLIAGHDADAMFAAGFLAQIAAARGDDTMLERCRSIAAELKESTYVDQRATAQIVLGRDALERGGAEEALRQTREAFRERGISSETIEDGYEITIAAAILLKDAAAIAEVESFVAGLPPARATPLLRAGRARLLAEQAHGRGDTQAATNSEEDAIALLRAVGARPLLAQTLLERHRRSGDAEALAEARAIYTELGASRWLTRIDASSDVAA
jgi:tetratricopeptide (TPR) repeat protein